MSAPRAPRFLPLADVAEILSCSVGEVLDLVRSGELPGMRIGERGDWRVEAATLEAFIADQHELQRRISAFEQGAFADDLPEIGGGRVLRHGAAPAHDGLGPR